MDEDLSGQFSRKVLEQAPVMCPWISAAPVGFSANMRYANPQINMQRPPQENKKWRHKSTRPPRTGETVNHFYHFLKLMQTFPDVHPATLHSVLCLCNHNFAASVETLMAAKNYKETYMHRKIAFSKMAPQESTRFHPYQSNNPPKQLQAQTSNGQLYDIVSIVSENNMPNLQYTIRNDELNCDTEVVLLDEKKTGEKIESKEHEKVIMEPQLQEDCKDFEEAPSELASPSASAVIENETSADLSGSNVE